MSYIELFASAIALEMLGGSDLAATLVLVGSQARRASYDFRLLLGQDFPTSGQVDLSDEVSEVLISSVCEYGWFGECWGDVFVGV